MYGQEPYLEVNIDGDWYVVPLLKDVGWEDVGYILLPGKSREFILFLKNNFGTLSPGKYRVVKKLYIGIPSNKEEGFSIAELEIK